MTDAKEAAERIRDRIDTAIRCAAAQPGREYGSVIMSVADLQWLLALLSAQGGGGWMTIESAPKDGTSIIVGGPGYAYEAIFANGEWMVMDADGATTTELVSPPTHWQPLPSSPVALGARAATEAACAASSLTGDETPR